MVRAASAQVEPAATLPAMTARAAAEWHRRPPARTRYQATAWPMTSPICVRKFNAQRHKLFRAIQVAGFVGRSISPSGRSVPWRHPMRGR